jgi:hypothetical protein
MDALHCTIRRTAPIAFVLSALLSAWGCSNKHPTTTASSPAEQGPPYINPISGAQGVFDQLDAALSNNGLVITKAVKLGMMIEDYMAANGVDALEAERVVFGQLFSSQGLVQSGSLQVVVPSEQFHTLLMNGVGPIQNLGPDFVVHSGTGHDVQGAIEALMIEDGDITGVANLLELQQLLGRSGYVALLTNGPDVFDGGSTITPFLWILDDVNRTQGGQFAHSPATLMGQLYQLGNPMATAEQILQADPGRALPSVPSSLLTQLAPAMRGQLVLDMAEEFDTLAAAATFETQWEVVKRMFANSEAMYYAVRTSGFWSVLRNVDPSGFLEGLAVGLALVEADLILGPTPSDRPFTNEQNGWLVNFALNFVYNAGLLKVGGLYGGAASIIVDKLFWRALQDGFTDQQLYGADFNQRCSADDYCRSVMAKLAADPNDRDARAALLAAGITNHIFNTLPKIADWLVARGCTAEGTSGCNPQLGPDWVLVFSVATDSCYTDDLVSAGQSGADAVDDFKAQARFEGRLIGCYEPACIPKTCAQLNATCGSPSDGCNGTLNCGSCPTPDSQCNAQYQCVPCTHSCVGICGNIQDSCGNTVTCTDSCCSPPVTCGTNTIAGTCCTGTSACVTPSCGACQKLDPCGATCIPDPECCLPQDTCYFQCESEGLNCYCDNPSSCCTCGP